MLSKDNKVVLLEWGKSGSTTLHVLRLFCLLKYFLKFNNLFPGKIKTTVKTEYVLIYFFLTSRLVNIVPKNRCRHQQWVVLQTSIIKYY